MLQPDPIRVLIVEDDVDQRRLMTRFLASRGYLIAEAGDFLSAVDTIRASVIDVVVSDLRLPDHDGMALMHAIRAGSHDVGFVIITAHGTIAHAVDALRQGADDYLAKPFEPEALALAIERVRRTRNLERECRKMRAALSERDQLVGLIGRSPAMRDLFERVERLAPTEATILISGESGTGKELAARAIHHLSPRRHQPFCAVNCATVPESLWEAEFFGAARGAYTGAEHDRPGCLAAAAGGTLFLDELGELPLAVQPKLLRVIQERRYRPLGSNVELDTDARLVAATNIDLEQAVRSGHFREDLFYRLNVVPLRMPPLRERPEDILPLTEHFATCSARRHGIARPEFPPSVMRRLLDHAWPGNVRELANTVERLVLFATGGKANVRELELPAPSPTREGAIDLPPTGLDWAAHERAYVLRALELARGNRSQAARLLGLPYKAYLYRLERCQREIREAHTSTLAEPSGRS